MSWNHDGCEEKVLWYTCPFRMEGEGHKELETIKREVDKSQTSKQENKTCPRGNQYLKLPQCII